MRSQPLPHIPPRVDLLDLDGEYFLLDKATRERLRDQIPTEVDQRFTKAVLSKDIAPNFKYSILAHNAELYIIYHGRKSNHQAGVGTFGAVKYLQHLTTGSWFVMKNISEHHVTQANKAVNRDKEELKRFSQGEYACLRGFELTIGNIGERASKMHGVQYYIVMQYANGSNLYEFQRKHYPNCHPQHILELFKSICLAVDEFHQRGGIHLDLKLTNMNYDFSRNKTSLLDFGFSIKLSEKEKNSDVVLKTALGTMYTIAPEVWQYNCSNKSDIFSVGACFAEFLLILNATEQLGQSSKLYPVDNPNVSNNLMLPNQSVVADIYRVCEKLMDEYDLARINLKEAYQAFERIQYKIHNHPVHVGIIHAEDCANMDAKKSFQFLQVLSAHCREIVVISNAGYQLTRDTLLFLEKLEDNCLKIHPNILQTHPMKVMRAIECDTPMIARSYRHYSWNGDTLTQEVLKWQKMSAQCSDFKHHRLFKDAVAVVTPPARSRPEKRP